MEMIVMGNENRTVSPTEANATSSRSHAVLQINVAQKDRNADINEPHTMATLSIIDLAGSERASATKNRGERLTEGANINKSLLALGSCINALCDARKHNHIPYRNSKLTRLLKFSLGGNCKTVMIVCVSPSSAHFDETQNTLRYANRAKNIQTKVTRNVYNVNRHVKDFLRKIDEQMALINELQAQQKDSEKFAFAKFRKQVEKREQVAKESILRVRSAYDHSAAERQEKANMMKKQRQIERRISLISAWIAGFDTICEARDEEEPSRNLVAMRKTAQGILTELESSRQHYHQRLAKNNWERAVDTALQTGIRQLKEADPDDSSDLSSLVREAELLKSTADREAHVSILEMEKGGDAAMVQVLLQAHFDTITILGQILQMGEDDAVQAARKMLGQIVNSCCTATSQVIKPEGGLPVTEEFAPSRRGTPKHRKHANLMGPSPIKALPRPSFVDASPLISSSPMKSSPRRRVKIGAAKKGISFTPKNLKRGVRWRDDTEDGTLVEFQATPKGMEDSSPLKEPSLPPMLSEPMMRQGSSPIPTPPEPSIDIKPAGRSNRFQTGFLSKKSDGSPLGAPPTSNLLYNNSSDSDQSPLREMEINKPPHRSSLHVAATISPDITPVGSGNSSSEEESNIRSSEWPMEPSEAKAIRSALKRNGSLNGGNNNPLRTQRRRSPTATSSGSPPNENAMFSASQARRMVNSVKGADDWKTSVLSPRSAPVVKVQVGQPMRRTTMGGDVERKTSGSSEGAQSLRAAPVRMSNIAGPTFAQPTAAAVSRSSLLNGKNVWR
jgi:kinesin family protein 18/19